MGQNRDSLVECSVCGHQKPVDFAHCLRHGWPQHCGLTMTLIEHPTGDALAAACDRAITAQLPDWWPAK